MTDINKHPTLRKLYETSLSLERLPASPEQTATAILLADANRAVDALIDSHSAALAAAVQAEREACAKVADGGYVVTGGVGHAWNAGTKWAADHIAKAIRSRGPAPAVDAPRKCTCDYDHATNDEHEPWCGGPRPVVDVLGVVREYVEAHQAAIDNMTHATFRNHEALPIARRMETAFAALRALVDGKGEGKDGGAR